MALFLCWLKLKNSYVNSALKQTCLKGLDEEKNPKEWF
jgi:hypothetical protein